MSQICTSTAYLVRFNLNQQLPQKIHGQVVVCLSVGPRTIQFHLVEWFSQIYFQFNWMQTKLSSSQTKGPLRGYYECEVYPSL
uniref:Uncharacterized protein n=1 Tax=Arundo donax TaxID=35708 RepID=A0A0A9EYY8_ARUDO